MENPMTKITEQDIKDFAKDKFRVVRIENIEFTEARGEDTFLISYTDYDGNEITEEFTESEFTEMLEILKFV